MERAKAGDLPTRTGTKKIKRWRSGGSREFLFSFCPQKLGRLSVYCVQLFPMETLNKHLLVVLLDCAQANVPASVQQLSQELGVPRRVVAEGLNQLDRAGLVSAGNVRLTLCGLMHATGLRKRALENSAPGKQGAAA